MSTAERTFFLFDHLEGEAREDILYRPATEQEDPEKIHFCVAQIVLLLPVLCSFARRIFL